MWRFILTVSLLCWGSEGQVTCKSNSNGDVDWYILYKAPAQKDSPQTGLQYLYIDSSVNSFQRSNTLINDPNGFLANTLRPLFTTMPPNFGFISYSDQPPKTDPRNASKNVPHTFGHSKGVLMVDKTGTGVWLLHSTPQFPFSKDQNFWPGSGNTNAQTFICITFPYDQFGHLGKHLQYIRAFPFDHKIPQDFHEDLKKAANKEVLKPPNDFQKLTSNGGKTFNSIAKQISNDTRDGDLYVTIARLVSSDLDAQTWGCQARRSPSYCDRPYSVFNIQTIRTVIGNWNRTKDHSKWCVAKNTPWVCIADVNRAPSQFRRRGGALCIEDNAIKRAFQNFVTGINDCTIPNIMDIDDDCEPDQDVDMYTSTEGPSNRKRART